MFSVITRFFKHIHCSPCDYPFFFYLCHNKENNYKLDIYIEHLTTKIQPVLNEHCTMFLIPNLAQLQWVSVNCTEKLINHVICFKGFKSEKISMNTTASTQYCGKNTLLFENICYLILSFTKHQLLLEDFSKKIVCTTNENFLQFFGMIFNAVSVHSLTVLSRDNMSVVYSHRKEWMSAKRYKSSLSKIQNEMIHTSCYSSPGEAAKDQVTFRCSKGECISSLVMCDDFNDCKEYNILSSDEFACRCSKDNLEFCRETCADSKCYCSPLYYKSVSGKCGMFTSQNVIHLQGSTREKFSSSNGKQIYYDLVDDLVSDCGETADDEPIYKSLLINGTQFGYFPKIM